MIYPRALLFFLALCLSPHFLGHAENLDDTTDIDLSPRSTVEIKDDVLALVAAQEVYISDKRPHLYDGLLDDLGYEKSPHVFHSSGLNATFYTSNSNSELPIIIVFAGTQNKRDFIADLGLGYVQFFNPRFKELVTKILSEHANSGRRILITGHSLGGALAQYFAFELHRKLVEAKSDYVDKLRVVTWNSLGAKELLESFYHDISKVEEEVDFRHYRVAYDPVSKVNTPLGSGSYTLPWNRAAGNPHTLRQFFDFAVKNKMFENLGPQKKIARLSLPNWAVFLAARISHFIHITPFQKISPGQLCRTALATVPTLKKAVLEPFKRSSRSGKKGLDKPL